MTPDDTAFMLYLGIGLVLVLAVGSILFQNGLLFLRDVFADQELAAAVNRLLLIGFFLVNLGLVMLTASLGDGGQHPYRTLVTKVGMLALGLGGMHLLNLAMLNGSRRRRMPQPVAVRPGTVTG
jgi:hypothetical protein